jgi:hypothetical protein
MSKRTEIARTNVSPLIARKLYADEAVAELLRAYRIYRQSRDMVAIADRDEIGSQAKR